MDTYYVAGIPFSSNGSLSHHGIKGQKWGIRRFQNPDGTLTEVGKHRYYGGSSDENSLAYKKNKAAEELKILSINDLTDDYENHSPEEWDRMIALRSGKINEAFKTDKVKAAIQKMDDLDSKYFDKALTERRVNRVKNKLAKMNLSMDTPLARLYMEKYTSSWQDKRNKLELEMAGEILKEIGFEDTPEARQAIVNWQLLR